MKTNPLFLCLLFVVVAVTGCLSPNVARGNPLVQAVAASDRIYMSSEHLTAIISPVDARVKGDFMFHYRADVPTPGQKSAVVLEIPIWFPEERLNDPAIAEFWKSFPKDGDTEVDPQKRVAFEKAIDLHAFLGGRALSLIRLDLLLTNSVIMTVPWEWHQEPGFCCLVFSFDLYDDSILTLRPLTISYTQPLLQVNGAGNFYYLPDFKNLPNGIDTADTNQFSITIQAAPNCALTVRHDDKRLNVEAGCAISIGPRHHQPIRATVTKRRNK